MQMIFGFATPQAIYKWIHGSSMPTIDNMVILAAMFGVTMDEIVVVEVIARKCGKNIYIQLKKAGRNSSGREELADAVRA